MLLKPGALQSYRKLSHDLGEFRTLYRPTEAASLKPGHMSTGGKLHPWSAVRVMQIG